MKAVLFLSDCLRDDVIEIEGGLRLKDHWSLCGFTGPSFISILYSSTEEGEPGINSYTRKALKHLTPFTKLLPKSILITQTAAINRFDGWGEVFDRFVWLDWNEYFVSDCVTLAQQYLKENDDIFILLFACETHTVVYERWGGMDRAAEVTIRQLQRLLPHVDVLCFSADHGETFWEDGTSSHTAINDPSLTPEQFKVPCYFFGVGEGVLEEPTSHLALAPTFLSFFGIDPPSEYEGEALPLKVTGEGKAVKSFKVTPTSSLLRRSKSIVKVSKGLGRSEVCVGSIF